MPPCLRSIAQPLLYTDLPVLPFLAPAVFRPWPFPARQVHTAGANARTRSCRHADLYQSLSIVSTVSGYASGAQLRCLHQQSTKPAIPRSRKRAERAADANTKNSKAVRDSAAAAPSDLSEPVVQQYEKDGQAKAHGERRPVRRAVKPTDTQASKSSKKPAANQPLKDTKTRPITRTRRRHSQTAWRQVSLTREFRLVRFRVRTVKSVLQKDRFSDYAEWKRQQTARRKDPKAWRRKWVRLGSPVRRHKPASVQEDAASGVRDSSSSAVDEDLLFLPGEFSSIWNTHFARLSSQLHDPSEQSLPSTHSSLLSEHAAEWARLILATQGSSLEPKAFLKAHAITKSWPYVWYNAMGWILANDPADGVPFLRYTHVDPFPPSSRVADALHYLAMHFGKMHESTTQAQWNNLVHLYCQLMVRPNAIALAFDSSHVRLLLPHCSADQVLALVHGIQQNHVDVHHNTLLHLADSLARSGHFEPSLDLLLQAAAKGADINSDAFQSMCATILRRANHQPDGLRVSLRIIHNLVELGIKLNVQLCNIVMLNAVEAGDWSTALSIYHSLLENGLSADVYTHAILLKGCKHAADGGKTLLSAIQQAIQQVDVQKAPVLATEILHCLYLHHFLHSGRAAFATLAEAYAQLFDERPLQRLGIYMGRTDDPEAGTRMQPTAAALGIMITAAMRQDMNVKFSTKIRANIRSIYNRYLDLTQRGEAPFAELCQTDHVVNVFLKALSRDPHGIPFVTEVLHNMQNPPQRSLASQGLRPCQPTQQTWSILLNCFVKHKKVDAAESVLAYMRKQGMQPNQVNWNMLLDGYAGIRDAAGVKQTLLVMEKEGWKGDEATERVLGKTGLRGSLVKASPTTGEVASLQAHGG